MRHLILFTCCLLFAFSTCAQDPQTGIPPFSSVQSLGLDAINRQNLNVNFSIPISSSPGRGINFSFPIVNDSLLWKKSSGNAWTPVVDQGGSPTWGWKTTLPVGLIRYGQATENCDTPPPIQSSPHYMNFSYVDPAGTIHGFLVDFYQFATICDFPTGPRTGYATDGSGYYLDATVPGASKVTTPAGAIITGTNWTDPNGNYFSATVVNSSETDWKDSAGHTPLKIITGSASIQYQFPDSSGAYQTTTLKLTSTNIKTNFGCSGVVEYTGTANLPTELDLPNGQKYFFTYEPTPSHSGYYTGRIKRVTLPAGGYFEHQYNGTNDSINCSDATVNNLSVVVSDGASTSTWQLARAQNGTNWNTTVTAPQLSYDSAANQFVYTFNSSGQEIAAKFYQGATTGTLLRTVNTTWTSGTPATQITILEDGSTQNEVETIYDSFGNLFAMKEHDWGTGTPGSVLRWTNVTYLNASPYIAANILNRPTEITIADGTGTIKSRTDIAYDESGYINSPCITGAVQHNDSAYGCSFTTRGNATTTTTYTDPATPGGAIAKHQYFDSLGNVVKADADCCQQVQWIYSATTNYTFPDSVTRGLGTGTQLTTNATFNSYTGFAATFTDENAQKTTYAYSDPGHLNRISSITRPDNAQITYSYDDVNFAVQVSSPVQGTSIAVQKSFLDGLGRTVKQQLLDGSSTSYSITETQYDTWGRAYKVSNPHNSTAQYWTETRTDALGRTAKTILPDNSATMSVYTATAVKTTDPTGKRRQSLSDGLGRMTTFWEPDPTNSNSLTLQTLYAYNLSDALTTITQSAQTRTYAYDALGRLASTATPEAGTVCFGSVSGGTCNADGYDFFNHLLKRTDARGVVTNYTYDSLNRLSQVSYNVGSTGVPATPTVTRTYGTNSSQNNNGRLITMTDGVGSENYTYDILGDVTQLDKLISSTTYTTKYQYNLAGELSQITYPSNRIVVPSYDPIGRPCAVGTSGSTCTTGTVYASGLGYNPAGLVTGLKYGNGIFASFGFSPDRLQLTCLDYSTTNRSGTCAHDSTTKFGLAYSFGTAGSNNGQIASITDSVDNGRSVTYTYDSLYRLSTAATTGSTNYPALGLSMTYDRYGNRTDQSQTAGNPPTNHILIATATNRISGDCYDANGNLLAESAPPCLSPTYSYDAENHTVTYSSSAYNYDGHGFRVKKCLPNCTSPTTRTVYVFTGSKVIAEYDNGAAVGSPSREYVYSGNTLLAKIDSSGTKYYHQDHISNRLVTDSSGNTSAQLGHFPFGESWYNVTNDKLLFTTYERDAESGNDFAMARYNVNRLGRFLSPDLLNGDISDPQSLNRYAYVLNDPCNLGDSLGLNCTLKFGLKGQTLTPQAKQRITDIFDAAGVGVQFVASGKADFYMWQNVPLQPPPGTGGTVWGDASIGIALINNDAIISKGMAINGNSFKGTETTLAAVGTVISHELGHLIIPCAHGGTPDCGNQGLMRPGIELGDGQFLDPSTMLASDYNFTRDQAKAIRDRCDHLRKYDSGPPKSPIAGGGGGGGGGSDPYFMGYSGGAGGGGIPDWLFGGFTEVVTVKILSPY